MQAGIAMAGRNFECVLCGRKFTRFTPDALLLSEHLVCDDCIKELHILGDGELRRLVSERLNRNPQGHSPELEKAVIEVIQKFGQN